MQSPGSQKDVLVVGKAHSLQPGSLEMSEFIRCQLNQCPSAWRCTQAFL